MDMGRVNKLVEDWELHMPNVQPFYAMKCNMDPVLLQLLKQRNVGLCCSNRAELEMVIFFSFMISMVGVEKFSLEHL